MNMMYNVITKQEEEGKIMDYITYKYTDYKSKEFEQVIDLRFNILFGPYNKVEKYDYDLIGKKLSNVYQ